MKRYFDHLKQLDAIKAEYRRLCKVNHPDVGGDTATMQEINAQYAEAVERIRKYGEREEDRRAAERECPQEFMHAVETIIRFDDLTVELVGRWIWVTGNTRAHKDALKAAGYRWASKKLAWYWHPEEEGGGGGKKSLEEIKDKYGCERLTMAGRRAAILSA